jgi:hypothetical protein
MKKIVLTGMVGVFALAMTGCSQPAEDAAPEEVAEPAAVPDAVEPVADAAGDDAMADDSTAADAMAGEAEEHGDSKVPRP